MQFSADTLLDLIHKNRIAGNKITIHFDTVDTFKAYLIDVLGFDPTWFYFVKESFRTTEVALRLGSSSGTYTIKHPNPTKNVYYGFIEVNHTFKKDISVVSGYSPSGFDIILSLGEKSIYEYCMDVKRYVIKTLPNTLQDIYGVDFKVFLLSHMPIEVSSILSKNLLYDTVNNSSYFYGNKTTLLKVSPLYLEEYICSSFPSGMFIIKKDI